MQAAAWVILIATLGASLAVDLFAHRGGRSASTKSSALWTGLWIALGAGFGLVVLLLRGGAAMQDYYAAYLIEETLSIDNLFVFLVIFDALRVPHERQHDVLFWGVLGALVLRAAFVVAGAAALERWHWVRFVFGGLLLIAAVRAPLSEPSRGDNPIVRWLARRLPISNDASKPKFIVREGGRRLASPLLVALIGLELTDVVFAVDSVPAALSVSHDRFVVYASNALAICGLRSLYPLLSKALGNLPYLQWGIAGVLAFTALKMIGHLWVTVPSWVSIVVTLICIGLSVVVSLHARRHGSPASAS